LKLENERQALVERRGSVFGVIISNVCGGAP